MQQFIIQPVRKQDVALLDQALRSLSEELGDTHPASIRFLEQAGFGRSPAYHALIALDTNGTLCGAVVFSPVVSTTFAATGLYVSDLWVARTARGCGLGKRLLAEASILSNARWGANYLKLAVYDASTDARRFYQRLGFTDRQGETTLLLDRNGIDKLRDNQ